MDRYPIAASSLEKYYCIKGDQFERQYKEHLSGYSEWKEKSHADKWLVFPKNIGANLSIDETSLSNGELYTVLTNKAAKGQKGALVAIIAGTDSDTVISALKRIPVHYRDKVTEITMDLSSSMRRIAKYSFPKATVTIDRFHVQKLALEALQEMRIKHRWEALDDENDKILEARITDKEYIPERFSNGDTRKQLLARSRYLLFKSAEKWTESQKKRANILFDLYPDLKQAYSFTHRLRMIYAKHKVRGAAYPKLALWYNDLMNAKFKSFRTIAETVYTNNQEILNFFINRATNASAESFNCKIKSFRAQLRGVTDVKYFLFRLANIYA